MSYFRRYAKVFDPIEKFTTYSEVNGKFLFDFHYRILTKHTPRCVFEKAHPSVKSE